MILVDSSVWIDFFNGRHVAGVARLTDLLGDGSAPLAMADLVLFEVLRGFRDERDFNAARRTLGELPVIEIGGAAEALRAAQHYRALRALGRTIRSPVDVLLASYCIENDCALLHSDSDFDALESMRGLEGLAPLSMDTPPRVLDIVRATPHVAEIWLARPEVRNAMNGALIAELRAAFESLPADETLRCIVLGGRGKAFCAGADLTWMRAIAHYSWDENHADAQALAAMLWAAWSCPVPVVGRIHGDCYAGGMGLAAICDVLIAADEATFCLSEARLRLLPATISPYVVRALGEQASRRYFVTAERFGAAQAHALGFVHELCSAEALDAKVAQIVAALTANGPQAVRACKALLRDVAGAPLAAELREDTARRIADIRASAEGREGVQAFLAKRPPAWLA